MIQKFFLLLFLVILNVKICNPHKFTIFSLSCLTNENGTLQHKDHYLDLAKNSGRIENRDIYKFDNVEYDEDAIAKYGRPSCVTYFQKNVSHRYTWFGIMSQAVLPVECAQSDVMHCFNTHMPFQKSKISSKEKNTSIVCCCSYDRCNYNNPIFLSKVQETYTEFQLRGIIRFFSILIFLVAIVIIYSLIEKILHFGYTNLKDLFSNKISTEVSEEDIAAPIDFIQMQSFSAKSTQLDPIAEMEDQKRADIEIAEYEEEKRRRAEAIAAAKKTSQGLMPPSLRKLPTTARSKRSKRRESKLPTRSSRRKTKTRTIQDGTTQEVTHLSPTNNKKEYKPWKKRSKAPKQDGVIATESTQSDEVYPIPPRPTPRVLRGGRVQGISMNYDESTFSDLN